MPLPRAWPSGCLVPPGLEPLSGGSAHGMPRSGDRRTALPCLRSSAGLPGSGPHRGSSLRRPAGRATRAPPAGRLPVCSFERSAERLLGVVSDASRDRSDCDFRGGEQIFGDAHAPFVKVANRRQPEYVAEATIEQRPGDGCLLGEIGDRPLAPGGRVDGLHRWREQRITQSGEPAPLGRGSVGEVQAQDLDEQHLGQLGRPDPALR